MNVSKVVLNGTPTIRGMHDQMQDVMSSLRRHIDLSDYSEGVEHEYSSTSLFICWTLR